jgi:hypothetical protein
VIAADSFRPPAPNDPTAAAYKDWFHLNVFDHASGTVGLVNVSLNGSPADARSRAVGAALLHVPGFGWAGNVEVRGLHEVEVRDAALGLEHVALAVEHASGTVVASARFPEDPLTLDVTATSVVPSVSVEEPLPLGSGWCSWYAVGRLTVAGEASVDGRRFDLRTASAYHDHNWGRWHWGDDLGWDWGAFLAPAPGPAVVLVRTTDREHRRLGPPSLIVYFRDLRRSLVGPTVEVEYAGTLDSPLRRVPGPMAALHGDRAAARLPAAVRLRGDDGRDSLELEFTGRGAAQLVTADPAVRGYGFIHEIVGEFRYEGRIAGVDVRGEGLGVVERAD